MDASRWSAGEVYVYRHPVDMRKGAAGLSALVMLEHGRDPMDRNVYLFVNKARNKIKLLVWHLNGYWVLYKSIEKQRFSWPDWFNDDVLILDHDQLDQLVDGYNLNGMRAHNALSFSHSI